MSKLDEEIKKRFTIRRSDDVEEGIDMQRASDFTDGYHQAEKDLELTEKDISTIRKIMFDYNRQISKGRQIRSIIPIPNESEYCKEVLKRFKEEKE